MSNGKSDEYQSFISHQDLQSLFSLFCHFKSSNNMWTMYTPFFVERNENFMSSLDIHHYFMIMLQVEVWDLW
jgi:hypothetical protein